MADDVITEAEIVICYTINSNTIFLDDEGSPVSFDKALDMVKRYEKALRTHYNKPELILYARDSGVADRTLSGVPDQPYRLPDNAAGWLPLIHAWFRAFRQHVRESNLESSYLLQSTLQSLETSLQVLGTSSFGAVIASQFNVGAEDKPEYTGVLISAEQVTDILLRAEAIAADHGLALSVEPRVSAGRWIRSSSEQQQGSTAVVDQHLIIRISPQARPIPREVLEEIAKMALIDLCQDSVAVRVRSGEDSGWKPWLFEREGESSLRFEDRWLKPKAGFESTSCHEEATILFGGSRHAARVVLLAIQQECVGRTGSPWQKMGALTIEVRPLGPEAPDREREHAIILRQPQLDEALLRAAILALLQQFADDNRFHHHKFSPNRPFTLFAPIAHNCVDDLGGHADLVTTSPGIESGRWSIRYRMASPPPLDDQTQPLRLRDCPCTTPSHPQVAKVADPEEPVAENSYRVALSGYKGASPSEREDGSEMRITLAPPGEEEASEEWLKVVWELHWTCELRS